MKGAQHEGGVGCNLTECYSPALKWCSVFVSCFDLSLCQWKFFHITKLSFSLPSFFLSFFFPELHLFLTGTMTQRQIDEGVSTVS